MISGFLRTYGSGSKRVSTGGLIASRRRVVADGHASGRPCTVYVSYIDSFIYLKTMLRNRIGVSARGPGWGRVCQAEAAAAFGVTAVPVGGG